MAMPPAVRLQKILAEAGVASRRKAEVLIRQGRVSVNGRVVTELGTRADPEWDHIKVDGRLLRHPSRRKAYWLLHKPRGVLSTVSDPQGRVTVVDLIRCRERIYPVGRLDYNSEGLIILTNDGELAKLISAAGPAFPKVYHVKVRSVPGSGDLDRLRAGLCLPDGTTFAGARIRVLRQGLHAWLEVTLTEGKNREIRRMFAAIGHPVAKLKRKRIGFLTDRGLEAGASRPLTTAEVERIFRAARKRKP